VFVDELDEIPDGAVTIFSAHGVAEAIVAEARDRGLPIIDATCPLVSKVHKEGQNHVRQGREVVLIGHNGHPEVEGTKGSIPGTVHVVETAADVAALTVADPDKLAYVTQTTLSVDDTRDVIEALKARFPAVQGPDLKDICYATQNRQQAVRELATGVDLLLVVGAKNSSNSNRLKEIGDEAGVPAYLIDDADGIDAAWLAGVTAIGVTAGASAPEELVEEVIARLGDFARVTVETLRGVEETMKFKLPRELADSAAASG
jgi:4-hydroxy-3-methylbut-2-enyl diphosphate reductase